MQQNHSIVNVNSDRAPQALPLVMGLDPSVTLERWLAYVKAIETESGTDSGILAAADSRGYLLGLFSYRVEPDLSHGRVLTVDNFVAADLNGRDTASDDLLRTINELAAEKDCDAIHVSLARRGTAFLVNPGTEYARFSRRGLTPDAVRMCKSVTADLRSR